MLRGGNFNNRFKRLLTVAGATENNGYTVDERRGVALFTSALVQAETKKGPGGKVVLDDLTITLPEITTEGITAFVYPSPELTAGRFVSGVVVIPPYSKVSPAFRLVPQFNQDMELVDQIKALGVFAYLQLTEQ